LPTSEEQAEMRLVRESGLGATAYVPGEPETWEGWEDAAVPREALGDYLRAFRRLLDRYGYDTVMYGHFGDGLVHCRINFDLGSEQGLAHWRRFLDEAADLVVSFGGSLSGEHGDGQARAALVERMYGPAMVQVFRAFRAIWDPAGRMNPGKALDAYPVTSNLRVGPDYQPPEVKSRFAYPDDRDSFVRATLRCVGVGKCRRPHAESGVMCPSYMATGEERHSTRGRARLLFEMLNDGPITDGWRSNEVEEALDLCFACKGCKSDCPVSVDMAMYKAEFRARHYARRLRPRAAWSMGLIHWWARIAGVAPGVVNALLRAPGLGIAAKGIGGISADRDLPRFAEQSFTRWFRDRRTNGTGGRRVILWPDTFNNRFHPHILKAAVQALEALGCEVVVPRRPLCCGRPLYDWGMLGLAKRQLRQIVDTLSPEIEQGTPLIGLEPACASAFRDELPALLPDDPRATQLADQTWLFSDFIDEECDLPSVRGARSPAVVQLHCHQHAVFGGDAEWRLLERLGVAVADKPTGCCGMAGSLGFEAGKQAVSLAAGEAALFPALRRHEDAMVLANGFSCREQIRHASGASARHIAELVAAAADPRTALFS
ncbi:MAG: FAD-linked oxidase C-terminal domain-containing protein, partial [Brevundimonas sp.]